MAAPLRGCVVWINGPPGVGKLAVGSQLSELLGPNTCPPPVPYNCDGEPAHLPDAVRRAHMLDRVLWARDRDAAAARARDAADPTSHLSLCGRCRDGSSSPPPPAEDVVVFTDWQRLDTAGGRAAAADFRAAARLSGRRFLAVQVSCARAEHVRRATSSPARREAAARWGRHVTAARAAGVLPSGRHHRGPLVVDAGELGRLLDELDGGSDDDGGGGSSSSSSRWQGDGRLSAGGCATMELDVTATEPREAAWLVMQRVRWEAVFGADRVPPSGPWRRLLLAPSLENLARLRGARRTSSSSSPPRQRLLSVPGRQDQQQEGGESSAASVLTTGSGTSRLVSVHNIVRFPSPSRIGSRESLWVRSRRRWRGAVPTPVSRVWRSIGLGRARGVVIAPSPGERPERPTTRSMIVLG